MKEGRKEGRKEEKGGREGRKKEGRKEVSEVSEINDVINLRFEMYIVTGSGNIGHLGENFILKVH